MCVEKQMEVRAYAIYKLDPDTREPELYQVGSVQFPYGVSVYAKKV